MPKYKNVNVFSQPIMINGKRTIVRPGDVIQVDKELDLKFTPFLEKVGDEIQLNKTQPPKQNKSVNPVVEKVKKDLETVKTSHDTEIKNTNEKIDLILKRLEIIKKVVQNNTQAIQNLEEFVYTDEENIVIEEDTENEKQKDT